MSAVENIEGQTMMIDTYCSRKNSTKFISVPAGTDVTKLKLSDPDLLALAPFKKGYDISTTRKPIALDPADIIAQINKHGYALHGAAVLTGTKP